MPLALDIETEGLMHQRPLPSITCVCLYDGSKEYRLVFYKVAPAVFDENKKSLLALLDASDRLIGFNAVLFDLEYIRRFFDVPQTQLSAWVEKTIDPFMCMKLHLGMTCTLKAMLALNGLPSKSASGLQAIRWAKEVYFPLLLLLLASCFRLLLSACCFRLLLSAFAFGSCFWLLLSAFAKCPWGSQGRMDLVIDYCMMDTKLVYMLCQKPHIRLTDFCTAQLVLNTNHQGHSWSITRETIVIPTLQETLHKEAAKMMFYTDHLAAQGLVSLCI